jgi:hypothetical protein
MNRTRVGLLCLLVAFVFPPPPAGAQTGVSERLRALEGRVGKLESGQVQESDLVGSYAGVAFALDLTGTPKVQTETGVGTLALRADHTASFTGSGAHCRLQQSATWSVACDPSHTGSFSGTGTWSIDANGSLVIQDANGDDVIHKPNFIGAGGRVIISGGTADLTGRPTPEIYSIIQSLNRLPNPPTP